MQTVTRPRVLSADVNQDNCLMLSTLLGFSDIEITCANTIDETLQLASAKQFDLYLLDTRFPTGSGLELCRQLRQFNPQTPVIFYSGEAHEADQAKGLAAGAAAYLLKPHSEGIAQTIFQFIKDPLPG